MGTAQKWVFWLVILCAFAARVRSEDAAEKTYFVQLIRGANDTVPPTQNVRAIGPKLTAHLRPVFLWTNYWEISRRTVSVRPGHSARVRLSQEREVEIDLTKEGKRCVAAYSSGVMVTRSIQPIDRTMSVIGSDRDQNSVWFIVVRRDKPVN